MRRAIAWSSLAYAGGRFATLLSTLVLARLLTPDAFGVVAAVLVFLAFVELASDFGMSATVVYEQEHGITPRVQNAWTLNAALALTLCVLGVLTAPLVAGFFGVPEEAGLFRLAALNVLITGMGNVQDGVLMRGLDFRRRTIPLLLRAAVRAAVGVGLALVGLGAASLVIAFLAGSVAWTASLWLLVPLRPTFELDRSVVRSMAGYGSGAVMLEIVAAITNRVDAVVIGRTLGETALGLYSVAYRIPELLIASVVWNVSLVAFPAMARKRVEEEQGLPGLTIRLLRACGLFAFPLGAVLAVTSPALVVVAFGGRWSAASGVLASIALLYAVAALTFPLGDVFKALGRQRLLVVVNLVGIPIQIGAMAAAAPAGLLTVSWVRAGVGVAQCLALIAMVAATLRLSPGRLARACAPGAAIALAAAAAAGAVRLLWPATSLPALLAQLGAAGAAGLVVFARVDPVTVGRFLERGARISPTRWGSSLPRRRNHPAAAKEGAS